MTPHPQPPSPARRGIRPGIGLVILTLAMLSIGLLTMFPPHRSPLVEKTVLSDTTPVQKNIFPPQPFHAPQAAQPIPSPTVVADPATDKLCASLFDESLPLQTRCQSARALARVGSAAALAALKNALSQDLPPYLKAAIAEGLGECPSPEVGPLLTSLTGSSDEIIARGAVRGLGLGGDEGAAKQLGSLLFDPQTPLSVRTEAALALGSSDAPGAKDLLIRAAGEIREETMLANILAGLGKKPFTETEIFFSEFLSSPGATGESKVAALEALGEAGGEVAPFLLKHLDDHSPELRAAAAWALTLAGGECSPQLAVALGKETDASVRASLYQALNSQADADVKAILPLVQNESNASARLAGLAFLANNLDSENAPAASDYFRQTAVPELEKTALESTNPQNRLAAVLALKQAQTPEAAAALQSIAQNSPDRRVAGAAKPTPPPASQ